MFVYTSNIKPTVVIVVRGSTILADTMLIVITWKLLPQSGDINHNTWNGNRRTKGLTSVMLYNGMHVFVFLIMAFTNIFTILVGMMYFM